MTPRYENDADSILVARNAYDSFSHRYDDWRWQEFWHRNEWPQVRELIASTPQNSSILDVGVGTGFYLDQLDIPIRKVCGLDISNGMLRVAQSRLGERVFLVQADAAAIPFALGCFDIVLVNRVATHLQNLDQLTAELSRVLSKNGRLIVSDLAPEHAYFCTEFEAPHRRILVETYKHSIKDWQESSKANGLCMSYSSLISAHNADWLPDSGFTSIDRSGRQPISFVLAFDRAKLKHSL